MNEGDCIHLLTAGTSARLVGWGIVNADIGHWAQAYGHCLDWDSKRQLEDVHQTGSPTVQRNSRHSFEGLLKVESNLTQMPEARLPVVQLCSSTSLLADLLS
jgi:hypothetical protein